MDKERKKILTIVTVATVAVAVLFSVAAVFFVNSMTHAAFTTHWTGWGDWQACAEIASVKPQEAVDTAVTSFGFTPMDMWSKSTSVGPVFVKHNGGIFSLTCSGGIEIGAQRDSWEHPVVSQDTYAWEVSIGETSSMCWPSTAWIEWNVSVSLYQVQGC